jgi:hypothetical protein|tara:strand:+ start:678 stop:908 length:231 start_codon:yes stop_codon:yes gene_type:complete
MSEGVSLVKFLMSSNQYKRLWSKIKDKHIDEELLELSTILMKDHSNILQKLMDNNSNYSHIEIVWADLEEDYGKEN